MTLIPAATVIPLRDVDGGLEVLMLRRNSAIAFGGMWVFPGGRIDPGDERGAADELDVARRAAAREALEEADLVVDAAGLVPFSHWTPPEISPNSSRRFATWFFACRAPVGEAGQVTIDGGEIHEDEWVSPTDMLARRDAGEIQLVPPTIVTLHDLARFTAVDDVLATCRVREPFRYATRIAGTDAGMVALWQGDAGYDTTDPSAAGPRHRLDMTGSRWVFEGPFS